MKRLLISLLFAATCITSLLAENYPYRSDYLWVTVPNHTDWLYKTGEQAVIDIQLYKYGIPCDAEISYSINDDMLAADKNGKAQVKKGHATITLGTRKTPGFRDLVMTATIDGKTTKHHVKVGFSVDKIKPFTQEPSDFIQFWNNQIETLRKTPLSYTTEPADEYTTDKFTCQLIKLKVDRDNHYVYAYLFIPKGAKPGQCPAVVCPPGAGIKTIKDPLRHRYYAENGFVRLEMEIHGLDPRLPKSTFDDISHAFGARSNNYLDNGIDSRDTYYMRHVYLALIRAIDLVTSLPEWDGKNVAYQGGSQGGALSLIAAALDKRVTQCSANHPALADMAGYSVKGHTGGYPHFKTAEQLTSDRIKTMAYYDVVNFAKHITCPVYMTWGYNDITCPPTTSYAVWNSLTCEKDPLITPINEHWTSEETEYSQMLWIKKHLK